MVGKFGRLLEMTKDLRTHILYEHNKYRNRLACGKIVGLNGIMFPTAARQRVLLWDWELTFTAEVHAKNAIFGHSACHGTKKYTICGQNIAESRNEVKDGDYKKLISSWMRSFFIPEAARVIDPVACAVVSQSNCTGLK